MRLCSGNVHIDPCISKDSCKHTYKVQSWNIDRNTLITCKIRMRMKQSQQMVVKLTLKNILTLQEI